MYKINNSPNSFQGVRAISIGGGIYNEQQRSKQSKTGRGFQEGTAYSSTKKTGGYRLNQASERIKWRTIRSPQDGYELAKQYLGDVDRKHFIVVGLDTKNNPRCINTCHIGSLNASIVSIREVFKTAIVANSASIIAFQNHPLEILVPVTFQIVDKLCITLWIKLSSFDNPHY